MAKKHTPLLAPRMTRHEIFCARAALAQTLGRRIKESTNVDGRDVLMTETGMLRALVTLSEALEGR